MEGRGRLCSVNKDKTTGGRAIQLKTLGGRELTRDAARAKRHPKFAAFLTRQVPRKKKNSEKRSSERSSDRERQQTDANQRSKRSGTFAVRAKRGNPYGAGRRQRWYAKFKGNTIGGTRGSNKKKSIWGKREILKSLKEGQDRMNRKHYPKKDYRT